MLKYYQFPTGDVRIVSCLNNFIVPMTNDKLKNKSGVYSKEEVERISLSRSKRNIREISLSNNFDYMVTLTIKESACDRCNIDECENLLRKYLKFYKRKNKNFKYILIAEKHIKSDGFHFHGFFGGVDPKDLVRFKEKDFDRLPYHILKAIRQGEEVFYFPLFQYNMGWSFISKIKHHTKAVNYIMKYITKDCVRNSAGTIYICSRGLKRADSYYVRDFDFKNFNKFAHKYGMYYNYNENEYCKSIDFNIDDLPREMKQRFDEFIKDYNTPFFDFLEFYEKYIDKTF